MRRQIIETLQAHTGRHILPHTVETRQDPSGPGVAVRWWRTKKTPLDFLWFPPTAGESSLDSLEDVTFAEFPPRSH